MWSYSFCPPGGPTYVFSHFSSAQEALCAALYELHGFFSNSEDIYCPEFELHIYHNDKEVI